MSRGVIEVLEIEGLAVARGERRLFGDFDLRLAAGEAVVVTGPNGSGKTSLLRVVAGLLRPLAGAVRFLGPSGPLDKETARAHGLHLVGHLDALKVAALHGRSLNSPPLGSAA